MISSGSRRSRPQTGSRRAWTAAGACAAALVFLLAAAPAAVAAGGDRPPRGPVIAIPDCHVTTEACGLDAASPDLSPGGCAAALAGQLDRRGITSRLMGPVQVSCAEGSDAIVAEVSITATCPSSAANALPIARAKAVDLWSELILRDCGTGEVVGHAKTRRAIDWQRRTLMRDLTEELGHHISEGKIRKAHPGTPITWMRGDVGGEHSIELSGGVIDIKNNKFNDFLAITGGQREDYAIHARIETSVHPVGNPGLRAAVGVDFLRINTETRGDVTGAMVGARPGISLSNAPIKADLGVVGVRGSVGYGWNITRNQGAGAEVGLGYYVLGEAFFPAEIEIDGLPGGKIRVREANIGWNAEVRYEWRFTPHLAFTAGGGWTHIVFGTPNVVDRKKHLPFEIAFEGATARAGIAGRF